MSHYSLNFECPRLQYGFLSIILVLEKCNLGPWQSSKSAWILYFEFATNPKLTIPSNSDARTLAYHSNHQALSIAHLLHTGQSAIADICLSLFVTSCQCVCAYVCACMHRRPRRDILRRAWCQLLVYFFYICLTVSTLKEKPHITLLLVAVWHIGALQYLSTKRVGGLQWFCSTDDADA